MKLLILLFFIGITNLNTIEGQIKLPDPTVSYEDSIVIQHVNTQGYLTPQSNSIGLRSSRVNEAPPIEAYWKVRYAHNTPPTPSGVLENESSFALQHLKMTKYLANTFVGNRYGFTTQETNPTFEEGVLQVIFSDQQELRMKKQFHLVLKREKDGKATQELITVQNNMLATETYNPEKVPKESLWIVSTINPRMITYGDVITLQHVGSNSQLWSSSQPYPGKENEYPVGTTTDLTDQVKWRVLPNLNHGPDTYMGRPLNNAGDFFLENIKTGMFLYAHSTQSANKSKDHGYVYAQAIEPSLQPDNQKWKLNHYFTKENTDKQHFQSKTLFSLTNLATKKTLYSNNENELTVNNETFQEVSASSNSPSQDSPELLWTASTVHFSPSIKNGSVVHLRHDFSGKYLGIHKTKNYETELVDKNNELSRWIIVSKKSPPQSVSKENDNPPIPLNNNDEIFLKNEKTNEYLYALPSNEGTSPVLYKDNAYIMPMAEDEKDTKEILRCTWKIRFTSDPVRHLKRLRLYHEATKRNLLFDPDQATDKMAKVSVGNNYNIRTRYRYTLWTIELAGEKKEDKEETTEKDKSKSSTQLAATDILKYNDVISIKHSQMKLLLGAASYTGLFPSEEPSFVTMWRIIDPLRSKTPNTAVRHDDVIALEHVLSNVQISVNPKEIPAGKIPTPYYQVLSENSIRIKQKPSLRPQVSLQIKFEDPTKSLKVNDSFTLFNQNSNAYLFSTKALPGPFDAQALSAKKQKEAASIFTLSSLHTKEDVDTAVEEATEFYNHRRELDNKLKNKDNYFRTQIYSAYKNKDSNALKNILQESLTIINDHYTTKNEKGEEVKMRITPFTPCSLHLFTVSSHAIAFADKLTQEELKELSQQVDIVVNHDILGKTHAWSLKRTIEQRLAPLLASSDTKVITREIVNMILSIPYLATRISIFISLFNNELDDEITQFAIEKIWYTIKEIPESKFISDGDLLSQLSSLFSSDKIRSLLDKYKVNYKDIYEKIQKQEKILAEKINADSSINQAIQKIQPLLNTFVPGSAISPKFLQQFEIFVISVEQKMSYLNQDTLLLIQNIFQALISKIQNSRDQNALFIRNNFSINIEPKLKKALELNHVQKKFPAEITTMKNKATLKEKFSYVKEVLASYSETKLEEVHHHCAYLIYRFILLINLMNDEEKADYKSIIKYVQEHKMLIQGDNKFIEVTLLPYINKK